MNDYFVKIHRYFDGFGPPHYRYVTEDELAEIRFKKKTIAELMSKERHARHKINLKPKSERKPIRWRLT